MPKNNVVGTTATVDLSKYHEIMVLAELSVDTVYGSTIIPVERFPVNANVDVYEDSGRAVRIKRTSENTIEYSVTGTSNTYYVEVFAR